MMGGFVVGFLTGFCLLVSFGWKLHIFIRYLSNNLRHIRIETFTHQIVMGLLMIWVVPLSSNSPHQDYYISSGNPYKPSFATGILGGGTTQLMMLITSPKIGCIVADLDEFTHLIFLGSTVQKPCAIQLAMYEIIFFLLYATFDHHWY